MLEIRHYPFPPPGEAPPIELESYPAPVLTSEQPTDRVATPTAAALLALAESRGWTGRITFAAGLLPHASYGTPGKTVKASEAVRLARGGQRAVAVRMGDSWSSLWSWSPVQFFVRHATLDVFREALR